MQVVVTHTIRDLANDLAGMPVECAKGLAGVVREAGIVGNTVARDNARRSSGKHGKLYPRSFSASTPRAKFVFGVGHYSTEYGPDASKKQGNMSFEWGSRNQPPHLDLNRSADLMGPALHGEVRRVLDRLFW